MDDYESCEMNATAIQLSKICQFDLFGHGNVICDNGMASQKNRMVSQKGIIKLKLKGNLCI